MLFQHFLRPLAVACALTATLSACSSGTKEGDTNVERGTNKIRPMVAGDGLPTNTAGDSATSGMTRPTGPRRPSGKEVYKAAADAKDRNHDGLAD